MPSPAQDESGPDPVSTRTAPEPSDNRTVSTEAAPSEAVAREGRDTSTEEMNGTQTDKTLGNDYNPVQPSDDVEEKTLDQGPKTNPPSESKKGDGTEGEKSKKQDRRYSCQRAVLDPLKMNMTKPVVMPLTSSELSLQCVDCHIIFSDPKSKERHLKLSHPAEYEQCILSNSLFACYHCDRHFTNSTELRAHQKTHDEWKPFKCPLCTQAFKRLYDLKLHTKVHIGQDGYTCPDCGKTCKTMTLLKYHRRVHTGEKPYVCKECGNRFSMSQTLRKHMQSHLQPGAPGLGDAATKAPQKKQLDASKSEYPCPICKATFKSLNAHLRHLRDKHGASLALFDKPPQGVSREKPSAPVIMSISVPQPSLLELEPNGPLQKVDGNIDTEPICRLIESLGNVQKVNQVVILGQVPPNAPPLEVQQLSELSNSVNLRPLQSHPVGLKPVEVVTVEGDFSNDLCDPMEQTIILEPITPDGQLIITPCPDLTFGARLEPEGEVMHQSQPQSGINRTYSDAFEPLIFQNEGTDLRQDPEQAVTLELTPILETTPELQQPQNEQQPEILPPPLVPTTELEKTSYQNIVNEQSTDLPVPSLGPTVEENLTSLQSEVQLFGPVVEQNLTSFQTKQHLSGSTLASLHAPAQASEEPGANSQETAQSQTQNVSQDEVDSLPSCGTTQGSEEKLSRDEEPPVDLKEDKDQMESLSDAMDTSPKKKGPSQSPGKQAPQASELPVNLMSAQELVKVRKRKPARALIIQGYMQELIGSILDEDLQSVCKPAKRKRTKSHLANFRPQKKNKKQEVPSQQCQSPQKQPGVVVGSSPLGSKVSSPKGKIANKNKKAKKKAPIKKKLQPKIVQKGGPKNAKATKMTDKKRKQKKKTVSPKKQRPKSQPESLCPQITQDSLLLLKGHMQPQLKVHKLDPSKTSGQETSPRENASQHRKNNRAQPKTKTANNPSNVGKKKGKLIKMSLLSFLNASHQSTEAQLVKPKTVRKRKASSNIETEGVITSLHSKRALECKDCGETFGEVASLQKHKTMVHILESPELTYTNGNIFEGVSRLDVGCQERVIHLTNPTTGWDIEPEIAFGDRERTVSFPALVPSPSLPTLPADEGSVQLPGSLKPLDQIQNQTFNLNPLLDGTTQMKQNQSVVSVDKGQEERTPKNRCLESEHRAPIGEDITGDAFLGVDVVTVGKENEDLPQRASVEDAYSVAGGSEKTTGDHATIVRRFQPVPCATHQNGLKDEEEEVSVQKKTNKGSGVKRRRGTDLKVDEMSRKRLKPDEVSEDLLEMEQEDCQVVYENVKSNSQMNDDETTAQTSLTDIHLGHDPHRGPSNATNTPPTHPILDESAVSRGESDRESQPSPGIYIEKTVTAEPGLPNREPPEQTERRGLKRTAGNEFQRLIKVEENTSDPLLGAPLSRRESGRAGMQPQQNGDIRTVLVKQESRVLHDDSRSTPDSRHSQWNAEQVTDRNPASPHTEEKSSDFHPPPDLSNKQCIFYPVKAEERELPLGAAHTNDRRPDASADVRQTLHPATVYTDDGSLQDLHDSRGPDMMDVHDFAGEQAEAEFQNPPDTRSFLLQSSEEDDASSSELSQPHADAEAEVLAHFGKNQGNCSHQADVTTLTVFQESPREATEPFEYFSRYFGWDTWLEISRCTNQASDSVTAAEVAKFVGIHIAMGTLKFPSPRLYWDNLTRVPLIAEAMALPRFLQLSRSLKLASSAKGPPNISERTHTGTDRSAQSGLPNDSVNPLWKVLPLLCRFQKGCQSFRRQGDYAVDQYLIPLTGKLDNNRLALHSTALIGFEGLLLHVDLKVDLSDKEDAVEKMVPKGSTVFLCKQELSTPAMLERLLVAGIHGAGRVGGAQGQIGDEFVSSDGKLMLRRSHRGFILSTAGDGHRNMASLIDKFEKAQAAARLNRDLLNLYSIPVSTSPTVWPLAVLWYLTDLALVNSWLSYRRDQVASSAPLSLMDFRLAVSNALIHSSGSDPQNSVLPQPSPAKANSRTDPPNPGTVEESPLPDAATRYDGSGHWPEQLAEGEGGRCRFGDCQRTSRVLCLKCCVFLCISRNHNCFLNFHSQASSGST